MCVAARGAGTRVRLTFPMLMGKVFGTSVTSRRLGAWFEPRTMGTEGEGEGGVGVTGIVSAVVGVVTVTTRDVFDGP